MGWAGNHAAERLWVPKITTWIPRAVIAAVSEAANSQEPYETGGLLLGYWSSTREAVITQVSFPGPNAAHFRYSYRPDYEHDIDVVRRSHTSSNGSETYLGDWHTHPGTVRPYLSFKDKRVLHRIANAPDARTPRPLGMVCAGSADHWRLKIWVGEEALTVFGTRFLVTVPTQILEYP